MLGIWPQLSWSGTVSGQIQPQIWDSRTEGTAKARTEVLRWNSHLQNSTSFFGFSLRKLAIRLTPQFPSPRVRCLEKCHLEKRTSLRAKTKKSCHLGPTQMTWLVCNSWPHGENHPWANLNHSYWASSQVSHALIRCIKQQPRITNDLRLSSTMKYGGQNQKAYKRNLEEGTEGK